MTEQARLRWRCRRGTVELEIMLTRFLDHRYHRLDRAGRAAFQQLLSHEDDQLIDWLLKAEVPRDGKLASLIATIRSDTSTAADT